MGIYSSKISDLNELPDDSTVLIPNDASNGGRALLLLQDAGLIKLADEVGITPTVKDIVENPKNLEVVELVAQQLPLSLADAEIAVIPVRMELPYRANFIIL